MRNRMASQLLISLTLSQDSILCPCVIFGITDHVKQPELVTAVQSRADS